MAYQAELGVEDLGSCPLGLWDQVAVLLEDDFGRMLEGVTQDGVAAESL
jgi:hypothetical protein